MSTVDPAWQEWAEKAAAEAAWQAKCHEMAGQIEREQMASERASQKEWQAKCKHERDRLAKAEYKQMCDQVLAEQTASLAEKAKDPAWQAQMDEITRQMKRENRAQNLARRMLQERRLEAPATDVWLACLCAHVQRSKQSEWGSQEQHQHDANAMGAILGVCDHLGITDPGADESQQLAREQQWQGSRSFDREATLCAMEDEGSHIGTLMLMLCHRQADWEPGDPADDMVAALFRLIDALPVSTTKQDGGAA